MHVLINAFLDLAFLSMYRSLPIFVAILLFFGFAEYAYGVDHWYFLRYSLPSGSELTSLSGELVVPALNVVDGGTYYIWPGLQTDDFNGIYQNVLQGIGTDQWEFYGGYCCHAPYLPWGHNLEAEKGEILSFSNVRNATSWRTADRKEKTGTNTVNDFPELSACVLSGSFEYPARH